MPWTATHFPAAMQNLMPAVRLKAVAIANALLEKGMDEGRAYALPLPKPKNGPFDPVGVKNYLDPTFCKNC